MSHSYKLLQSPGSHTAATRSPSLNNYFLALSVSVDLQISSRFGFSRTDV